MATNPMQKKTRISFILGMLVMLVIAILVVALLYMKIQNQKKEIEKYQTTTRNVYTLTRDVKSGQVLTADMFMITPASTTVIPAGATGDIITTLSSYSLSTSDGRAIYYNPGTAGNSEDPTCYYVGTATDKHRIYVAGNNNEDVLATTLSAGGKAHFYAQENTKQGKTEIEVSENAVVAKVDMSAKTIITGSLISRSEEITTNDLRKEEYNVIALPVDLAPGEYVDIRLRMPDGQDYIVVSKKRVSIPVVNGQYLADTIQMNLTEEEIVILSSAIVENFKVAGSQLRATRYAEAGMQSAATMTYYPSNEVQALISSDPNIVRKAINGIRENRQAIRDAINSAVSKYGEEDNVKSKTEESITSTEEARKNYLQSLPVVQ